MSTIRTESLIGRAWRLHREGNNRTAIEEFEKILRTTPNDVDTHYGLGLALRADGQNAAAIESFTKAMELSQRAYDASRQLSEAEGHHGSNDLETTEDDRFMMLHRMIGQRLRELGVNTGETQHI